MSEAVAAEHGYYKLHRKDLFLNLEAGYASKTGTNIKAESVYVMKGITLTMEVSKAHSKALNPCQGHGMFLHFADPVDSVAWKDTRARLRNEEVLAVITFVVKGPKDYTFYSSQTANAMVKEARTTRSPPELKLPDWLYGASVSPIGADAPVDSSSGRSANEGILMVSYGHFITLINEWIPPTMSPESMPVSDDYIPTVRISWYV